jgi:hypothetical protein
MSLRVERSETKQSQVFEIATLWLTPRLTAIGKPLAPKGALRKRVYTPLSLRMSFGHATLTQ